MYSFFFREVGAEWLWSSGTLFKSLSGTSGESDLKLVSLGSDERFKIAGLSVVLVDMTKIDVKLVKIADTLFWDHCQNI